MIYTALQGQNAATQQGAKQQTARLWGPTHSPGGSKTAEHTGINGSLN